MAITFHGFAVRKSFLVGGGGAEGLSFLQEKTASKHIPKSKQQMVLMVMLNKVKVFCVSI